MSEEQKEKERFKKATKHLDDAGVKAYVDRRDHMKKLRGMTLDERERFEYDKEMH